MSDDGQLPWVRPIEQQPGLQPDNLDQTPWLPPGFTKPVTPDPSATGEGLTTLGRFGLTAGLRAGAGLADAAWDFPSSLYTPVRKLISPEEEARYQAAEPPGPGTKLADAFFRVTGIPEYQSTSAPGRMAQAGFTNALAGSAFGPVGFLTGLLGGTGGQTVRELGGGERAATLAEIGPGLLGGYEALRQPAPRGTVPSTQALADSGNRGYAATRTSPIVMDATPLQQRIEASQAQLQTYDKKMMPESQRLINETIVQPDSLSFNDIQNIRERANNVITSALKQGNPHEVASAEAILNDIDAHVENLPNNPSHIITGTPGQVADTVERYQNARADYAAAQRSNRITGELQDKEGIPLTPGVMGNAEVAAEGGGNYARALRGQLTTGLRPPSGSLLPGLVGDEYGALAAARRGSLARNLWSGINALSGGGPAGSTGMGILSAVLAHLTVGDPTLTSVLGVAAPTARALASSRRDNLARQEIANAAELIRMRSPAYRALTQPYLAPPAVTAARRFLPGLLAQPLDEDYGGQ